MKRRFRSIRKHQHSLTRFELEIKILKNVTFLKYVSPGTREGCGSEQIPFGAQKENDAKSVFFV